MTRLCEFWSFFKKKQTPVVKEPEESRDEPEEEPHDQKLARWKSLWNKGGYPHAYVYHPDFDYNNPRAEEGGKGVFYIGHTGNGFVLMSPYVPSMKMIEKVRPLIEFGVSMPDYKPLKMPNRAVLYGNPKDLAEEFGVNPGGLTFMSLKKDGGEGWYYVDLWHSELPYKQLIGKIKGNWDSHNLKHAYPMPDYKHPDVREEIMDVVIGSGYSGMGKRHDFSYPDPDRLN